MNVPEAKALKLKSDESHKANIEKVKVSLQTVIEGNLLVAANNGATEAGIPLNTDGAEDCFKIHFKGVLESKGYKVTLPEPFKAVISWD